MFRVRECQESDLPRLREIFAKQGFEYDFPDLAAAQFVAKQVVVDDNDVVQMAVCARQTVELYMLADGEWSTPKWRFEALKAIHESMRKDLAAKGFEDAHLWLPPQLVKSFSRRLMRCFRWRRPVWADLCRDTRP